MDRLQNYLKSLNPDDTEKEILIYGKEYHLWNNDKYLGTAFWTQDENVGDSFQRTRFDKEKKMNIQVVYVADKWMLIINKKIKFRVHFSVNGFEDEFIITGDSFEDIKEKANAVIKERGLDVYKNNIWSEQI